MIARYVPDLKNFMNALLGTETFDHFLLKEARIKGDASYLVDGAVDQELYSPGELEERGLSGLPFVPFGMVRPRIFGLVRGKVAPHSLRLVLLLSPENLERTVRAAQSGYAPEDVAGMSINVNYQNGKCLVTNGVSYRTFSMDKGLEREWDAMLLRFFQKHGIETEDAAG